MPKITKIKHQLFMLLVTLLSLATTNAWAGSVSDLGDITINVGMSSVPEPGGLALLAIGLVGVGLRRRVTR